MAHTELREALGEAIARLPEREKLVVTLYYYEELTLREIGEVLGVTESRVSQLHTKAILRLKARLPQLASAPRATEGRSGPPLVERVRLPLLVPRTHPSAARAGVPPLVEPTCARVALEDPEPKSAGTQLLDPREQCIPDSTALQVRMDVEVPEHVRVEGGEAGNPTFHLGDHDLVLAEYDVADPGANLVVGVHIADVRPHLRVRGEEDLGELQRRSDAPGAASTWSAILPARWDKSLNSPIRAAVRAEQDPERCRHRAPGTGKTSLVEALLFQAGATNRLGSVEASSTVSDWDEDEQRRQMSLAASVCHLEWQGRKINLVDTPGDPGFQADTLASLRVVEGALFAVNGVNGVEVQTTRLWERAEALGLCRVVFVTMLDRERADFFVALEQLRSQPSDRCVAVQIPIGHEHELEGIVDLFHMRAYMDPNGEREAKPVEIPESVAAQAAEYREQLVDSVVETDEALMERYLEEGEVSGDELAAALKNAVVSGELFPVACGVPTKNLGTTGLLDLLVEGIPSPAKKPLEAGVDGGAGRVHLQDRRRSVRRRINVFRVLSGTLASDSNLVNSRTRGKERVGSCCCSRGRTTSRRRSSARATSARSPSSRRPEPAMCS